MEHRIFGIEAALSVTVLALLVNITMLVKMRFGDKVVTKLSTRQYQASLVVLIVMVVHLSAISVCLGILYESPLDFYADFASPGTTVNMIFAVFYDFKFTSMLVFILVRAQEQQALVLFSYFQRMLRLENLQVEKDKFRRLEDQYYKIFHALLFGFVVPNICMVVLPFLPDPLRSCQFLSLFFLSLTCVIFTIYQNATVNLMLEMFKYHRMAFHSHKWSLSVLFVATEISLAILVLVLAYWAVYIQCLAACDYLKEQVAGICTIYDLDDYSSFFFFAEILPDYALLIPMGAFFILNKPHDCYMCLGKDPERIYSRFQLNLEERARRHVRAKFNNQFEKEVTNDDMAFIEDLLHNQERGTSFKYEYRTAIASMTQNSFDTAEATKRQEMLLMDEIVSRYGATWVSQDSSATLSSQGRSSLQSK